MHYTVQTQTVKPVIMSDSMVSSRELIAVTQSVRRPHEGRGQALCGETRVTSDESLVRTT
jgi:hypothetical protein